MHTQSNQHLWSRPKALRAHDEFVGGGAFAEEPLMPKLEFEGKEFREIWRILEENLT